MGNKYYDITDFALYSSPLDTDSLIYRPADQYQPDYPIGFEEELTQTVHYTETGRIAWRTNYLNTPKKLNFVFADVPYSIATIIYNHIETYSGTFYIFLGTNYIGTLTYFTFQKAFIQDGIAIEEDDVGNYSFNLPFTFYDDYVNIISTAQGWGTNWGTNWGK